MSWNETRKKLLQLRTGRSARPVLGGRTALTDRPDRDQGRPPPRAINGRLVSVAAGRARPDERLERGVRARSLCVASGKGGTGKSVVCASLAALFSSRGRTLIVDADLGVGNAHILQDVSPPATLVEVVEGRRSVREVLVPCAAQVDLLAAGSGVPRMADLSSYEMHLIANGLEELELEYRYLIVDSAAGVSRQTLGFAQACDVTLIVTTPDLTAMTDAYAFLKVLLGRRPELQPLILVNRVGSEEAAREVVQRIDRVCDRFLGVRPRSIGWIPEDVTVSACVNRRGSVVTLEPHADASYALRRAAVAILEELGRHHARGMGRSLLEEVGYPARLA